MEDPPQPHRDHHHGHRRHAHHAELHEDVGAAVTAATRKRMNACRMRGARLPSAPMRQHTSTRESVCYIVTLLHCYIKVVHNARCIRKFKFRIYNADIVQPASVHVVFHSCLLFLNLWGITTKAETKVVLSGVKLLLFKHLSNHLGLFLSFRPSKTGIIPSNSI